MRLIVFGIIFSLFVFSCSTDDTGSYSVGSEFVDSNINLRLIDTFTVNTGTYKFEEFTTSGSNRILLGNLADEYFGNIKSISYLELHALDYDLSLSNSEYDSIGFVLNYDGYYSGDTLVPQTYKVFRINEDFEPEEEDGDYYNNSVFLKPKSDEIELGSITFEPESSTDTIYIPLDIDLGAEIYNKIVDKEITSSTEFTDYFKGVAIVPDTLVNSNVMGYNATTSFGSSANSSMRVYYTTTSEDSEGVSNYIEFVLTSDDQQFNSIESSYDDGLINDELTDDDGNTIDVENVISSEDTNDLFYIQAGAGISARINIPSIKKLNQISEFGTSLGALLSFRPLKYNSEINILKDSLSIYVINEQNKLQNLLLDADGSVAYAILNDTDELNPYYSVDLGGYVKDIIGSEEDLDYSLMVQFNDLYNSVDRVVLKNEDKEDERVKLTVQYLNY